MIKIVGRLCKSMVSFFHAEIFFVLMYSVGKVISVAMHRCVSGCKVWIKSSNNLLITMQGKEGFAFSGEGEIGVVLDTHITKELKEEGYIREILSKVQNMRKDKGFEVLDNINLYVCGNEMLEKLIKENEELIKHDTLTVNIKYGEKTSDSIEMNINGENLNIDVKKI